MSETKIIRCLSGRVKDYVIDMRKNSKTFLKIYSVELSEYNKLMLYIPEGFAHGFQALENNTEAIYLSSNSYSKEHEIVINPNDILFNINFDFKFNLSQKDNQAPFIDDLSRYVV
jgi:dTDP-4-dehydrorhamnose 3,5-epimerase